jgi:hypothetical protein
MRSALGRACTYGLGLAMIVSLVAVAHVGAQGVVAAAPEIDGGYLSAGLGGLTAAVLILRSRRRPR